MRYGVSEESKTSSLIISPKIITTSTVIELFEIDGFILRTLIFVPFPYINSTSSFFMTLRYFSMIRMYLFFKSTLKFNKKKGRL